jgi:hypothetical protein
VFHGKDVEIRSDESCRDARKKPLDNCSNETNHQQFLPVMNLNSLELISHGIIFFPHNKSINSTFSTWLAATATS